MFAEATLMPVRISVKLAFVSGVMFGLLGLNVRDEVCRWNVRRDFGEQNCFCSPPPSARGR